MIFTVIEYPLGDCNSTENRGHNRWYVVRVVISTLVSTSIKWNVSWIVESIDCFFFFSKLKLLLNKILFTSKRFLFIYLFFSFAPTKDTSKNKKHLPSWTLYNILNAENWKQSVEVCIVDNRQTSHGASHTQTRHCPCVVYEPFVYTRHLTLCMSARTDGRAWMCVHPFCTRVFATPEHLAMCCAATESYCYFIYSSIFIETLTIIQCNVRNRDAIC